MRLETADGRALEVNVWNWGVLHDIVAKRKLFTDDIWAAKRSNGGGMLDGTQCSALAEFLAAEVLPYLAPGERLYYDGTVTSEPDDGTFFREEHELWRNYSLHHDVLMAAIAFFREAAGPVGFY
jgi:hypothetical protein